MSKRIYFETFETKTVRKKGYVDVDDSYTQVYHCLFKLAFKMKSVVETQLLFYFCTKATNVGVFNTDDRSYKEFLKHSDANGGGTISRVTFTSAIKNLTENQILIKLARGQYQLNPFLLWKSSKEDRSEHIEEIMIIPDSVQKNKYLLPKHIAKTDDNILKI